MEQVPNLENLEDLFLDHMRSLHNDEMLLMNSFPALIEKASSPELKFILNHSYQKIHEQVTNLEISFNRLKKKPGSYKNSAMIAIISGTKDQIKKSSDSEVGDAILIKSLQHICHYKIAGYGSAYAYADALDYSYISSLLFIALQDEKKFDKQLNDLAIKKIILGARAPLII